MADNKFMGTFDTEEEVLRKIEELKAQGATEDHMYVMAKDEDQLSMVRGRTDVDYKAAEIGWKEKFMGFLSGNEPVRQAFAGMGVDEQEADRYYHEVQNGRILLFVDRDYSGNSQSTGAPQNAAYGTPSPDQTNYVDTGTVARDGLTVDTNDQNNVYFNEDRRDLYSDGSKSPSSGADTSEETAGVGDKTGTGFGLGTGGAVNDTPSPDRNLNDFSATNRDRDSSASTDSSSGIFGSGGQGADERTTTNQSSGLFGSDGSNPNNDSTSGEGGLFSSDSDRDRDDHSKSDGGVLGGLFGGNSDRNEDSTNDVRDHRDTDTFGTSDSSSTTDSGAYDANNNDTTANRDSSLFETGGTGLGADSDSSRGRSDDNQGLGTGADTNRNAGAFTSGSPGVQGGSDTDRAAGTDEETLRLHEERLQVDKDRVQTGEVNVGKRVVEERQTIDVPVEREEIVIERRPVDREVTDADRTGAGTSAEAYQEGDSIHIPLTEERVEVNKTNVVSEEIVVGKRKVQDTETINETVRREEADIDDDSTTGLDRNDKDRI